MKFNIKYALLGLVVLVIAVSAYEGLRLSGTPQSERTRLMDVQRRQDLMRISSNIDIYWNLKYQLPDSLSQLQATRESDLTTITDPSTKQPYEYRKLEGPKYELCAVFEQPLTQADLVNEASLPTKDAASGTNFWLHGVGRACFQFEARENTGTISIPPRPIGQ